MTQTDPLSSRIARYLTTIAVLCCLYGAAVWLGRGGEPDQAYWLGFYSVAAALMLGCRAYLGGVPLGRYARGGLGVGQSAMAGLRPVARRAGPAVVALLVVTSTFGGLALVGTQPTNDSQHTGVAQAANSSTGAVFVGTGDGSLGSGSLQAIEADTRETRWSKTGYERTVVDISLTPDGSTVFAVSTDSTVKAYDSETGDQQWSYTYPDAAEEVSVSPDGSTVYAGGHESTVKAIDAGSGNETWSFNHSDNIEALTASPDGDLVVASAEDSTTRAIDVDTGQEAWVDQVTSSAITFSLSGDIAYTAAYNGETGVVRAHNSSTGEVIWSDESFGVQVFNSLSISPTGETLYVGEGQTGNHSAKAINLETRQVTWSFDAHSAAVNFVSSSPDGETVYSTSNDGTVRAIDAETGGQLWSESVGAEAHGLAAAYEYAGAETSSLPDLNGTVENQNGQPVPNATVTVSGIDREQLSANPSELNTTAQEILSDLENPTPPEWTPDRTLTGGDSLFGDASTEYVAAHPTGDWGLTAFSDEPQLGNPRVQLPAGEEIALSVWDPSAGGLVQDGVNSGLPGSTVDDTAIVVESIDHAGGTVDTQTIETDTTYDVGLTGGTHDLATTTLPAGFYRVYPEGSPETGYVIVVGDPDEITQQIVTDLENEAGQYTAQAKQAQDYLDRDVLKQYTTTTDANGSWSVDAPDSVTRVSVQAHKAPPGLEPEDPRNVSMQDVREFYVVTEYNGSYVMPADAGTYSVPSNDITVDVVETEAPQFADLGTFQNASERFRNMLQNMSYSDLPATLQQRLDELDRASLEETADKLTKLTNQNSQLESRVEELSGLSAEDFDINTSSSEELQEQVQAQQQAISELRSTIETSDSAAEVVEGVANSSATFGDSLTEEQVRVVANFPNGTSKEVPSEYLTLDQSAATIIGQGGTQVAVEDYPVADASGVIFDYQVATEDGLGSTTTSATDPTADSIGLDAISLSSLRPGPDEQVDVTLVGDDETQITEITDASAVGPNGEDLNTSTEGADTLSFDTAGQGRHYVEATFETASGEQGTLTHRTKAGPTDQAMPPGVRIKDTPFGTLAIVGDGFEAGGVDTQQGGSQIDVTAQIGVDEDAPSSMHVYAHATDIPPDASLSMSVVRGDQEQSIQRNVEVIAHLPAMTAENAILYRADDALPRDGEDRIGDVSTSSDETTITTVTDANGQLTLETNNNPGLNERFQWWLDRNVNVPSIPFVGQTSTLPTDLLPGQAPALPLPDASGALGWDSLPVTAAAPAPTIDSAAAAPAAAPA